MSDYRKGYISLNDNPHYINLTVNHSINFVDPEASAHKQTIESTWRNSKMKNKAMLGTHGVMIDSYLCGYFWRRKVVADFTTLI